MAEATATQWRVPLAEVEFGPEEPAAVQAVLESRWLSMGAVTQAFETEFATFCGAKHAFAVTNATAGLHLSCLAAGLGPGDEVILPALTFVATANAIRYTGATPIFADITSTENWTLSPEATEACITPRTRAIMLMHYAGYTCNMPAFQQLAERYNLVILEDAAHAVGSELNGRHLGTWGQSGCYSFFPNKNMTTAEGGMLVTNEDAIAEKIRVLRSHGMTSLTWDRHRGHAFSYDVVELGYNYRIDELRSALGRVQLTRIPAGNQMRRLLTEEYRQRANRLGLGLQIPFTNHPGTSACHLLPALLPQGANRARFMEIMKQNGIQTSIHYPPIHTFSGYRGQAPEGSLPVTETVGQREVTLPLFPAMTEEQLGWVLESALMALETGLQEG